MSDGPETTPLAAGSLTHRLAKIRHELRTPINHIIGYSELIQEEAGPRLSNQFKADLQKIRAAALRLVALINEFFSEARFGRSELTLSQAHHELRTPVNHIIGYSEMLQEFAGDEMCDDVRPDLERIQRAARNWLDMMQHHLGPLLADAEAARRLAAELSAARRVSTGDTVFIFTPAGRANGPLAERGRLLVVDDDEANCDMLSRRLERNGYAVAVAKGGAEALEILRASPFDLVLLDLIMPGMDGDEVLEIMKHDPALHDVPVIIVSSMDEVDAVARCILLGAEDYLPKPFNPVLLQARIGAALEKRRLRDQERAYLGQIRTEQERSATLLLNFLPESIAARIKQGETTIVDRFPEVSVLFADIVNFTELTTRLPGTMLVRLLDEIFTRFDLLAQEQGLEKIKTIGDAYMVVGGLPTPRADHAVAVAELALNMIEVIRRDFSAELAPVRVRIGINSGPVVAGVIGRHKFSYDLWGDTVNVASRMESHGRPDCIQVTDATHAQLVATHTFRRRGPVRLKGRGKMVAWWLTGRKA